MERMSVVGNPGAPDGRSRLPLVILAGADRRPARLPERARGDRALVGWKGVAVRIAGRPLVAELAERFLASAMFSRLFLVGPARVYRDVGVDAELVDADGSFGENVRAGVEAVARRFPDSPIAFSACDVLPDAATVRTAMGDWEAHAPSWLWFPLIAVPDDRPLGASAWKPKYRVVPRGGAGAVRILPGHLVVADPRALRLDFLYRLFELGYRTRNRPIGRRRWPIVRGVVLELLREDLRRAMRFESPSSTWSVLRSGFAAGARLESGTVTCEQLEEAVRRIFVRSSFRRRNPERRVRLPILDELSLALDIDTEEEARAVGGAVRRERA
jgi:hypothetical protein